jgi:hypothetical protein
MKLLDHFKDSPRKALVRTQWNTPVLERLHLSTGLGYFYCGLPGPEILDVLQWRRMIRRVTAFQMEADAEHDNDRRRPIAELSRRLEGLSIPYRVHPGLMETTVVYGQDDDGIPFEQDELITLYNLDFCSAITGQIRTPNGEFKCLRFWTVRKLLGYQEQRFAVTGDSLFIMLLTMRDEFHPAPMQDFVSSRPAGDPALGFLSGLPEPTPGASKWVVNSTPHLKAFVQCALRETCAGRHIATYFLPPIRYVGSGKHSNMIHFTVLCRHRPDEGAFVAEGQPAEEFLGTSCMRAGDDDIRPEPCCDREHAVQTASPGEAVALFFG